MTFSKEAVEGHWRYDETLFRDDLALLVVDVSDTPRNRKRMKAFKEPRRGRRTARQFVTPS